MFIPKRKPNREPHDIYAGRYEKKPNKEKVLFLRKDQILGDIDAQIEIVTATHTKDDGTPLPVFENAMEKHKHSLNGWINKYLDIAKQRMAAYIVVPEQKATFNAQRDWEEKEIHLSFPWYWDETTFDALSRAVADFIVNSVLFEFFSLTITSKDPITIDKQGFAEEASANIKHYCVASIPGTMKKKLHPY